MSVQQTPGVYRTPTPPAATDGLTVGVPAFLGYPSIVRDRDPREVGPYSQNGPGNLAQPLRQWSEFLDMFGTEAAGSCLAAAVRGFFENGGQLCYVAALAGPEVDPDSALQGALQALDGLDDIDLVAVPDLVRLLQPLVATLPLNQVAPPVVSDLVRLQQKLIDACESYGGRFALLDAPVDSDVDSLLARYRSQLSGTSAALYYPWLVVPDLDKGGVRSIPPCGHVAGVYASTDRDVGVFKAPANVELAAVLDLARDVSDADQDKLNPAGVNALRVFPGRGIRVWGARTISTDPIWRHVNVRRLLLTAGRWIERNLGPFAFEPHDSRLWTRITRELTQYLNALFEVGAIKGASAAQAFFVKCDAETNPPATRDTGLVVTDIGLAPSIPNEFIIVRISLATSGVALTMVG